MGLIQLVLVAGVTSYCNVFMQCCKIQFHMQCCMRLLPFECGLLVAGERRRSRRERLADLLDFATEHFLNDAELAQQHAQNVLIEGLYSEQYWVSSDHTHLTPRTVHFGSDSCKCTAEQRLHSGIPACGTACCDFKPLKIVKHLDKCLSSDAACCPLSKAEA